MSDLQEEIIKLRAEYAGKNMDKIKRLFELEQIILHGQMEDCIRDEIHQIVHKMAGVCGLLGLKTINEAGYKLELYLISVKNQETAYDSKKMIEYIQEFNLAVKESFNINEI